MHDPGDCQVIYVRLKLADKRVEFTLDNSPDFTDPSPGVYLDKLGQ
jgi:hypothetical protein